MLNRLQVHKYVRSLGMLIMSLRYLVTYNILSDVDSISLVSPTVPHRDREEITKHALNTPPHPRTGRHPVDYMYLRTFSGRENWI